MKMFTCPVCQKQEIGFFKKMRASQRRPVSCSCGAELEPHRRISFYLQQILGLAGSLVLIWMIFDFTITNLIISLAFIAVMLILLVVLIPLVHFRGARNRFQLHFPPKCRYSYNYPENV